MGTEEYVLTAAELYGYLETFRNLGAQSAVARSAAHRIGRWNRQ